MAVLNFPADTSLSPYEENGIVYVWDGQAWVSQGAGGGGGSGVTPDLQSVTDEGNTTTNDIITTGDVDADNVVATGDVNATDVVATGDVNANNVVATGDVQATSFNGGPPGFRNILINGNVSINQRGRAYGSTSVGDYWADRWKKTAGGMTQIVEEGGFLPSTEYTLSGTGITTQQITSPASGNWTIPDVPSTATMIQLEIGSVATPFEQRPYGLELTLCQRYYQRIDASDGDNGQVYVGAGASVNSSGAGSFVIYFPGGPMRASPSVYRTTGSTGWAVLGGTPNTGTEFGISRHSYLQKWDTGVGTATRQGSYAFLVNSGNIKLDAEL